MRIADGSLFVDGRLSCVAGATVRVDPWNGFFVLERPGKGPARKEHEASQAELMGLRTALRKHRHDFVTAHAPDKTEYARLLRKVDAALAARHRADGAPRP